MTTVAIVPIQRLTVAKSRLRHRLGASERHDLVLTLLHHVLTSLGAATLIDETLVVTPDPLVAEAVVGPRATALLQSGTGLNAAILQGRDEAVRRGATALLIMLGDLPLVTSANIDALVRVVPEAAVVLAPDRHQRGTNALVLSPPDVLDPLFGVDSLRAHRTAAKKLGLNVREYRAIGTGFDLDESEDLDELQQLFSPDQPAYGR
jgi:2-phospho-L-lactate guanylyltransferase